MSMRLLTITVLFGWLFSFQAYAENTAQRDMNQAIASAEKACLVGDRIRFRAVESGGLAISKSLPGGTAIVVIDQTRVRGSQFFDDEAVRQLVEDDIRKCMSAEWPKILQTLQKHS
jgi:hypothetical protein